MKIEENSNITSLKDYRKNKKIQPPVQQQTPAKITDFKVISSMNPMVQKPMGKEEVRAILDPDSKFAAKNETVAQDNRIKSKVIDFEVLSSLYPNIKKSKETELIEFFLSEGYNLTFEQAGHAIAKYINDAKEARPMFDRVQKINKEFEDRIKELDVSKFDKISSMYEKKDKREMIAKGELPDSFIPSKASSKVTKNIAKLYAKALKDILPDYEIEIEDDGTDDPTNNLTHVKITTKDHDVMLFFYNDFLSTLKKRKVSPNAKYILYTPPREKYDWHYDSEEGVMCKVNKIFSGAIGAISKDSYNEKGEPEFYIDINFDAGPTYYGLMETLKFKKEDERKADIDKTGNMTEEEIAIVKDMISKDPDVNKYYEEYGLLFVNSCLRDGNFNLGVAMAQSLLIELGEYFSADGEISLDYVKELISHIEEKDHYIDEDVFEVANDFLIKELNSQKDYHKLIYSVLDYTKNHKNERTFDFMVNLADEIFSFDEVKSIMDLLHSSSPRKQGVIIQKTNKLINNFDASGDLKPETRIYDQLLSELHLK